MYTRFYFPFFVLIGLLSSLPGIGQSVTTDRFGPFGTVTLYHPAQIRSVVLFASGDGGWNQGVVDMARVFTEQGALVVGFDNARYLNRLNQQTGQCVYPAADAENLSIYIQKKLGLLQYHKPILVGYSSGATVVYGMLAQAPANTFRGALALGFCPDLSINKPFCEGAGLKTRTLKPGRSYYLEAVNQLSAPLVAVVGQTDKVCDWTAVRAFLKPIGNASLIAPANVGHGFLNRPNWLPQVVAAYQKLALPTEPPPAVSPLAGATLPPHLPLTTTLAADVADRPMAFIISGDGGWTSFDASLANALAQQGIPSVGLDAQAYFWQAKNPASTTADVQKIIEHFGALWHKPNFILVGYSFGASLIPFINNRLSPTLQSHLQASFLLSPDTDADFEIHLVDMINLSHANPYNVLTEIKRSPLKKPTCIFGQDEDTALATSFRTTGAPVILIPGGHHYNNGYALLAQTILRQLTH